MNIQLIVPGSILIPVLLNHSHFQVQVAELMTSVSNATTLTPCFSAPVSQSLTGDAKSKKSAKGRRQNPDGTSR